MSLEPGVLWKLCIQEKVYSPTCIGGRDKNGITSRNYECPAEGSGWRCWWFA